MDQETKRLTYDNCKAKLVEVYKSTLEADLTKKGSYKKSHK